MPTRILTLACALAAVLALATTAAAKLPAPSSNLIEPAVSIGGVKLGQSVKKAKAAWGKGECSGDKRNGSCQYAGTQKQGSASFGYVDGKVVDMFLSLGLTKQNKRVYRTPLAALKTVRGIGLGSTHKAAKQAYPKAKEPAGFSVMSLKGKGRRYMTLSFENGRIFNLSIGDGEHQG
ncbi:MAG TPA: hypothetical protein VI111_01775 [Thermoleophilaceae bacterium]